MEKLRVRLDEPFGILSLIMMMIKSWQSKVGGKRGSSKIPRTLTRSLRPGDSGHRGRPGSLLIYLFSKFISKEKKDGFHANIN